MLNMAERISSVYHYLNTYDVGRNVWVFSRSNSFSEISSYSQHESCPGISQGLVNVHEGLTLKPGVTTGTLITDGIEIPEADWLVTWWNADIAGSGCLSVFLQVEVSGRWSPWYPVGTWKYSPASAAFSDEMGGVLVDTLKLTNPTRTFKLKLEFSAGMQSELPGSVLLRRVGVISRSGASHRLASKPYLLKESALLVPRRSQMLEEESIKGKICSPTCVAMALDYFGINFPTTFVAASCFDAGAKIFGNWTFNVAALWSLGLRARLEYFLNFEFASAELYAGKILIASIRYEKGELSGAPVQQTDGHLVVVTGLKKDKTKGYLVLVNDPAAPDTHTVQRAYPLDEFEKAWTGYTYVIEGKR